MIKVDLIYFLFIRIQVGVRIVFCRLQYPSLKIIFFDYYSLTTDARLTLTKRKNNYNDDRLS